MSAQSDSSVASGEQPTVHGKPGAVEVKGNMVTLMSVLLNSTDLIQIESSLAQHVKQAPGFFASTPVVIDFSRIEISDTFNFKALFKLIRTQSLMPVAVRGVEPELSERLQQAGVPIVETSASERTATSDQTQTPARTGRIASLVVEQTVRSGQQIYAKGADLIVLAQSNAGAELVADGNIHVYGALRGKALCGVTGDESARIFCSQLEAELVSVAGRYKILEEIPAAVQNKPVQIRLSGEQLLIEPL
jgi:septum site-determining protein MinC